MTQHSCVRRGGLRLIAHSEAEMAPLLLVMQHLECRLCMCASVSWCRRILYVPLLDVSHPCALEWVNDLHLFMLHHSWATFSSFFFQACKNGRHPTRAPTRFSWFSRVNCAKILFNRLMNMCRQEKWYLGTIMDRQSINFWHSYALFDAFFLMKFWCDLRQLLCCISMHWSEY